jgi:hypothetical protein
VEKQPAESLISPHTEEAIVIHALGRRASILVAMTSTLLGGAAAGAWAAPVTVRVSVDTAGGDPDSDSFAPSISATGRYVAFESYASDLVPGDGNGLLDVFVRDLVARTTVRASVDTGGGDSNGNSFAPSISADGRYVAFQSGATDLVSGDGNLLRVVFVRRMS